MTFALQSWERWYDAHQKEILSDFFDFLRFQSVGTDRAFDEQTRLCAEWLKGYLDAVGLETSLIETSGQPIVWATDLKAGPDRPTLMIYHHYDVQPPDPLELWKTPPFEPSVRDGSVFARGAQDNKGQCFYTLTALRALYTMTDHLPFNLKVLIEGEEESGSDGLKQALRSDSSRWKADALLVIDSGIPALGQGAITLGCRGIITGELEIRTASGDMHSGTMGGIAWNPIRILCALLAKCWDDRGKVAVPHFYDAVDQITDDERQSLDLEMDEKEKIETFGLKGICPEPGYSLGESVGLRPTLEINGIHGGYTGEGFKTVLPAVARAKVSCRLVPSQDPKEIARNLEAHLRSHLPKGVELSIALHGDGPAFRGSGESDIAKRVAKAYEEVLRVACKKIVSGGSIPIVSDLAKATGGDVVLMGYGLDSDQIHAPNEHMGLDRLKQGFLTVGQIFTSFHE